MVPPSWPVHLVTSSCGSPEQSDVRDDRVVYRHRAGLYGGEIDHVDVGSRQRHDAPPERRYVPAVDDAPGEAVRDFVSRQQKTNNKAKLA